MLSLDRPITVDGLSVYRDHADPSRFWYLPGTVSLARRQDGQPALTLLVFRPADEGGPGEGGGFMMFETTLELSDKQRQKIESRVMAEPGVIPPVSLNPPPFENGSVQCIALNLQGPGGTEAEPGPDGTFFAVEKILGATMPAMDAANRAAFSLVLDQDGAVIMNEALLKGTTPVGVVYSLSYLALRPALDVEIVADLKMVYNGLSAALEGQYMFVKAGIEAAFEFLKSKGAITIKVINFTDEADEKAQEEWALKLFTDHLLGTWFTPTLSPGQTKSTPVTTGGLPGAGTTGPPPPAPPPPAHPDGHPATGTPTTPRPPGTPATPPATSPRPPGTVTAPTPTPPTPTPPRRRPRRPRPRRRLPRPHRRRRARRRRRRRRPPLVRRQSSPRPRPSPPRCLPASRSATSPRPAAPASRSR